MSITLVLGGARSGKSRHAEALLAPHPTPWTYIATAEAWDDEMRARIAEHQARRDARWRTVAAQLDLPAALAGAGPALVDCLTLWLTNLMLGGHDVAAATTALESALAARLAPTVLVANEVGLGIVPDTKLGRAFRDAAGVLNQRIAARADHVHFIAAGLPLLLKGKLP
ncbi:bifunctional adenosylcobinamide kinase/adenosylcobinamide-phosphate guanylyltransferase [Roseomonas haemaphysalidis]|uniref:Bifunctional adenosylcobalamin biosynthesis protein n=1 Tax=Roseomonas haemaphysalidis TaxID=2768162 RepID=A0ABS3KT41_9PROT|nr:bifunctional adenosylcobinamide kinase/adenosylcobinamide-phosphate guanylyltransferase [Roseomonas haemaphysalidis]MBO1080584.1 bifunctional adenosylcobinamide kinase/adenosylcobinamide-phosphate guanylyltransferase [Roseomonas haemaphysalidis]